MKRRRVNQIIDPVLTVELDATSVEKLVYLLVSNKPFRHGKDYTRIIYVGMTGAGISRIAGSASKRIKEVYDNGIPTGLRRLDAYVIWAKAKRGPQTIKGRKFWSILERALLIRFHEKYGRTPLLNGTGHNMKEMGEFEVFTRKTIDRIIGRYT